MTHARTSDSKTCPLCGKPNDCRMESGIENCWCAAATVAHGSLARVPDTLRNKVCICRTCATSAAAK